MNQKELFFVKLILIYYFIFIEI